MAAANDDDGIVRRHGVEVAPVRQPMLLELRFVPVAVGDDDVAGTALLDPRGDRGQHVGDRARARQIHTGSAAGVVQVIVGEAGNDRPALQIDHGVEGPASFLMSALVPTAVNLPPVMATACAIENRASTVIDVTVDEYGVGAAAAAPERERR